MGDEWGSGGGGFGRDRLTPLPRQKRPSSKFLLELTRALVVTVAALVAQGLLEQVPAVLLEKVHGWTRGLRCLSR